MGWRSSVEDSYTSFLKTNADFVSTYDTVYGIDYDWWSDIPDNGKIVGAFLDTVGTCSGLSHIDLMAHSEGVPVTLSALTNSAIAKVSAAHFIAVAGPILGTPIADTFTDQLGTGRYALLTGLLDIKASTMVFPPATPGGILDILNDPFAQDLATDSSGNTNLATIRSSWLTDPILSQIPIVMVGGTGSGDGLGFICHNCFGIFIGTPFDGIVGLDSAFGAGFDLPLYRIPAFPLFHTSMIGGTTAAAAVTSDIELQLSNPFPPKLTISTSSPSASCQDGRWCFGPPGTVFVFTASGLPASSSTLDIYIQDPTGTEDAPISVAWLSDGTLELDRSYTHLKSIWDIWNLAV